MATRFPLAKQTTTFSYPFLFRVPVASTTKPASTPAPASDVPDSLDREAISSMMTVLRPRVELCKGLAGVLKARIEIAPDGHVVRVSSWTSVAGGVPSKVARCVDAVIEPARFPTTKRGSTFTYPFRFVAAVPAASVAHP